ncbi:MAG TPA: class I SAM-dependent methyltransferase, partial [Solirubrobacteraceae bacterium]|nr:class I SAM-dependent methyltransferase [Solirubrobacteraceae bacterium]
MVSRFRRRPPAPEAPPAPGQPFGIPERKLVPRAPVPAGPATEILFSRLTDEQLREVEARLLDAHRGMWEFANAEQKKRLALALALSYCGPEVSARTGLRPDVPPDDVHAMNRDDPTQTGGSYEYADLVLESLERIGSPLAPDSHGLDFSCSSGRVVRPLAAALPDVHWHGCDPNAGAIGWAGEHILEVDFFVSETSPPLPFDDGSLDLVFAISVWSHYSEVAALRWLTEMRRVIRPGGHLMLTTHGLQSCVWFSQNRDPWIEARLGGHWIAHTAHQLERAGHCFWDVFGDSGDWGVRDKDWGL